MITLVSPVIILGIIQRLVILVSKKSLIEIKIIITLFKNNIVHLALNCLTIVKLILQLTVVTMLAIVPHLKKLLVKPVVIIIVRLL